VSSIGVEQGRRGAPERFHFDHARKRRYDFRERTDLAFAEARELLRLHRDHVNRAVCEDERERDVVGDALRPQILEHQRVQRGVLRQPMADHFARRDRDMQRAGLELFRIGQGEVGRSSLHRLSQPPDEAPAEHVRMQGTNEQADAPKWNPAGDEAVAQLADFVSGIGGRPRAVHKPVNDALQTLRGHGFP
jgi:hypothetical protein